MIILAAVQHSHSQDTSADKKEIKVIIDTYIKSVLEKDSIAFYNLFNDGAVTWCAALRHTSQIKEIETLGAEKVRSNYFTGTYKEFMRTLFRYENQEDQFDNIRIIEDGTVASVTMDYSFWANNKMTNWGHKYLALIKRDGQWKITSVIYSLELTKYFPQPSLKERKANTTTN